MVVCAIGLHQSLRTTSEYVKIDLREEPTTKLIPVPYHISSTDNISKEEKEKTLKICQITDPHLGTMMTKERLRGVCETIAGWNPDLVLLTGDNITVESYFAKDEFAYAYEPLRKLEGRTFACLGNHDYESLETVEYAMKSAGIKLLKDEETVLQTRIGPVQIVGTEFSFRNAKEHITKVIQKFPRKWGHQRIFLVHNPAEFVHFPDKEVDLVFSGHTHGGQIGLFSLGIHWTVYNFVMKMPDFGLWGNGHNRLYVHRGTGHYGFPIRIGVSNEVSLLEVSL